MGATTRLQGVKEYLYREMPLRQRDHWGSHLWAYLHTITLIDYDDSETNQRMSEPILPVLKQLTTPCHKCNAHYKAYVEETLHKVNLSTSMALFKWGWELHNQINRKHQKEEISYDTAVALWAKEI